MQSNSTNSDLCRATGLIPGEGECNRRISFTGNLIDNSLTTSSYSLTLIDALDTLAVMGNNTEFVRVTKLLTEKINFDSDINVSVFETNIRIVGGLLSAHLLSHR